MDTANAEIGNGKSRVLCQLVFDSEIRLLRIGFHKVGIEDKDSRRWRRRNTRTWSGRRTSGVGSGGAADSVGIGDGNGGAGIGESFHLKAIGGMRSANQDGRCASIIDSVADADNDPLVEAIGCPGKAETRAKVILVSIYPIGKDASLGGDGIQYGRLCDRLVVVTKARVQGKAWGNSPFILNKGGVFVEVRLGGGPVSSDTPECLDKLVTIAIARGA